METINEFKMIRSKANLLLSIKRVTEINKGKQTAGIDSQIVLTSGDRIKLFNEMIQEIQDLAKLDYH